VKALFVPLGLVFVLALAACGGSGHRNSQQIRRGGASGPISEIQTARKSRRFFAIFPRHPASAPCSIGGATRRLSAVCSTRVHYVPDAESSVFFTAHVHVRNAPVVRIRVVVTGRKVVSVLGAGSSLANGKKIFAAWSLSTAPSWISKCLPKGRQLLGAAPAYLGLTFAAAQRRTNSPVFAGGGGRCSTVSDDVGRTRPIAVVYNTWNPRDRRARIIAAVRAVPDWEPGN